MLKKASIGTKVTALLAAIIVIAFSLMNYITFVNSSKMLEKSINSDMLNQAVNNGNILSQKLNGYKMECQEIVTRGSIRSMDWGVQGPELTEAAKDLGFISMSVATPDGDNNYINGSKANISNRDYFKTALTGMQSISDPLISKTDSKLVVVIATPIKDHSDKVSGVLVAALDGQFLSTLCQSIAVGKSGYGFIISSNGTTIGHKDETLVAKMDNVINNAKTDSSLERLATIENKMLQNAKGTDIYTYKGTEKYIAYSPILGTKWSLGVTVNQAEAMGSIADLRNHVILFAAVAVAAIFLVCMLIIRKLVTNPLKKTVHMIEELAKGHLKSRLKVKSHDEIGKMSSAMNMLADTLQYNVLGSMKQIAEGDMNVEIDSKDAEDEIAPVIKETAATVKNIVNETSGIIEAVNQGDLSDRCNDAKYTGEWRTLAQKINALCDSVAEPVDEVRGVIEKISRNDFTTSVSGQYNGIFKDLAEDTNALKDRMNDIQGIIVNISKGDTRMRAELEATGSRSENDQLIPALVGMMRTIENLIGEVEHLTDEAAAGNVVNTRGDETEFEGGYREIIRGINGTLDAMSAPLSETLSVLGKMAVNDFTLRMSEGYQGDFKVLVQAVNDVHNRLQHIQSTAVMIANGDISELEAFKGIGKRSENDELAPAFTRMMESIQLLIDEITGIAQSAAAGKLDLRGDASRYSGGYAQIIGAVNSFLDAVEKPTNEITAVMNAIAQADFGKTIEGEFNGQFKVMVDSVNQTSERLSRIIAEMSDILTNMANGDFSLDTIRSFRGDFRVISDALNTILDSLNELFSNVAETSAQVAAGSAQVSQGSQTLSQGATEQASSVEELSASITEIAAKTKNNAMSAGKANSLTAEVKAGASDGKHRMDDMLKSMDEISESSNNISKIIKVIDDIAFQTNILALNAAVEAARAGQYGKGFAVVAEEVRNLAGKSAEAARDTTALIEGTVKKVESGTEIAKTTAGALDGIVKGIDSVAGLVEEIAAASNEQATGISQINSGLEQVSRVIQTNSATAEESAAASEELSSQATVLEEQVAKFVLRGTKTVQSKEEVDPVCFVPQGTPTESKEDEPEIAEDCEFGKY